MAVKTYDMATLTAVRAEWTQTLENLVQQIQDWTADKQWQITKTPRRIVDEGIGAYMVPDLTIDTPHGQLILEAQARGVPEAPGRVELAAWPTLYRVMLLHRAGETEWTIRTDSGIPIRQPWTRETFLTLAEDLLAAE